MSNTENSVQLRIKRLHPDAKMPVRATEGAACFDLHALHDGTLFDSETFCTGLAFEVPQGYALMIYSRSGHGFNHDVRLANCVGVIDSDYRGEVKVKLTNDCDSEIFLVSGGDRIAQAMLIPVPVVEIIEADALSDTARGTGGLGSTGA